VAFGKEEVDKLLPDLRAGEVVGHRYSQKTSLPGANYTLKAIILASNAFHHEPPLRSTILM
jgi:hypothetical protein